MRVFAIAWVLACSVEAGEPPAPDPVTTWNREACEAIARGTLPPGLAARQLAILHLAIYQATREASDPEAAATAAAHEVCRRLFSGDVAHFDRLATPHGGDESARVSREIARRVLETRSADGSTTTVHYKPSDKAGMWRRTTRNRPPELPHWPGVRPFVLEKGSAFRPPPPPPADSDEFGECLDEVRRLGGKVSPARTDEQSQVAVFWSDFTYTTSPPGHWNEIAREVPETRSLSVIEKARLFAILNVALADAGIAAFDCKYHYNFWRPITAIDRSRKDGDTAWEPFLATPSHPEYPSAHSTFSGAAATVLEAFFGRDAVPFEVGSDSLPGKRRRYASFSSCAEEIGMSRIYGGIHYRFSDREGKRLGAKVGKATWTAAQNGTGCFEATHAP